MEHVVIVTCRGEQELQKNGTPAALYLRSQVLLALGKMCDDQARGCNESFENSNHFQWAHSNPQTPRSNIMGNFLDCGHWDITIQLLFSS